LQEFFGRESRGDAEVLRTRRREEGGKKGFYYRDVHGEGAVEKVAVTFFFLCELCSFAALREVFCRNFLAKISRGDAEVLRTRRRERRGKKGLLSCQLMNSQ